MIIKSIKLINFRNHAKYFLTCEDEISLILGENGCGKTSVLEAIYILTRGKSFRATDPDILRRGSAYYRIELEFVTGEKTTATYDGKIKFFHILDKKTKRLPRQYKYPVILFLPSDLNLITNSPSRRREYFNRVFSEFDDMYSNYLSKYEKSLRQRNELLKNSFVKQEDLFSWDILLAKYGTSLYRLRDQFVKEINQRLTSVYRSIAENQDKISITYKSDIIKHSEQTYLEKLNHNFDKDHYLGYTSFGIHHDDYIFEFNHQSASGSASRGEIRSIILALKFIEADLIFSKTNHQPIILLDDVFSELDETRRRHLIDNFKHNQIIITSVEAPPRSLNNKSPTD